MLIYITLGVVSFLLGIAATFQHGRNLLKEKNGIKRVLNDHGFNPDIMKSVQFLCLRNQELLEYKTTVEANIPKDFRRMPVVEYLKLNEKFVQDNKDLRKKLDDKELENTHLWASNDRRIKQIKMLIDAQQRLFKEYTDANLGEAHEQQD